MAISEEYNHPYIRYSISQTEISIIPTFDRDVNELPLYIDACGDLTLLKAREKIPNQNGHEGMTMAMLTRLLCPAITT